MDEHKTVSKTPKTLILLTFSPWHLNWLTTQKRFHSRYNFGYGILLYMLKMPYFCPFAAYFSGFEGVFSFVTDKSAIRCPGKTEVADFVSFKGLIVQGINLCNKYQYNNVHEFDYL